jgi:hypothetical protein
LNTLFRCAATLAAAVVMASSVRAAGPTDPAELFPPGTLAYAELHDPASVAPQIAAAFKGTVLEDSIAFIQGRRDKSKDPRDHLAKDQLAILGLLASPEMAAELKKVRGIAIGVTGITDQREPDAALAILTGDSPAIGLAARAILTMTSVRKVAAVGDVPVYQFRQPAFVYDPSGRQVLQNDKPPVEGAYEPTFAYLPGLFVVGTSKTAVGAIVARFQGKAKGSLAGAAVFKEAAAAHRQPGLFFFANVPEFFARIAAARKKEVSGQVEPESLGWFRLLVNEKGLRSVAGCVKFRDGGIAVTLGGSFDPAQKSPLFEFLSGPGVKVELLRHAPPPATIAFAVSFPEKNRAAAVIGWLDALAKASGELGRLPSEAVKELEAKYKVSIAQSLIGKTSAATVVLPVRQDLPKGAQSLPIMLLHTESAAVAAAWEDFLPKLIGDLAGTEPPQVATETISGLKVLSLPGGGVPWKAAVHYTRKAGVFAVGLDRKWVVAAVNGNAGAGPALSLPLGETPVLIGSLGLGGMVRLSTEKKVMVGPVVPVGPAVPAKSTPGPGFGGLDFAGPGGPSIPGGANQPENQKKEEAKTWEALLSALDNLPPTALTARRIGMELRVELWQPKTQSGGLASFINAGIGWFDSVLNRNPNPNPNSGYGRRFGRIRGG